MIPKQHKVSLNDLNRYEWQNLHTAIRKVISIIEKSDLTKIYKQYISNPTSQESIWFCKKALQHPKINQKPDAYNYGINDGKAAGRTVNHFHFHIIPRYQGDMNDPRGGVGHAIPQMGNYKIPKEH